MRGSGLIAGAILGAVALVGTPAASSAAPDPYSPSVETECSVDVPARVDPGRRVVVTISIAANTPATPKGKVDITIRSVPEGAQLWFKTVSYNGGEKRVVGPVLPKDQKYKVSARFRPSDDSFDGCRVAGVQFAVEEARAGNPDNDNDGPGGLLPDTGGPALLWLLLGLGLVGGGTATVVYTRRRTSPTPA